MPSDATMQREAQERVMGFAAAKRRVEAACITYKVEEATAAICAQLTGDSDDEDKALDAIAVHRLAIYAIESGLAAMRARRRKLKAAR